MSKVFRKILCPVGFDRNSAAAISFASEMAEPGMSTIYLLHVVSPPTIRAVMLQPQPILTEAMADRELEKLRRAHLPRDVQYQTVLRSGDPADLIVSVAEELEADLIVIPTHGNRGLAAMLLGSVAERVVREARRPVLTIQPAVGASIAATSEPVAIPIKSNRT